MYKVVKIEEHYFDTLKEAIDKKDNDYYCDSNVKILEVDNCWDEGRLVMEDKHFDFQWFKDFVDDFKGNIYIRSYRNPVSVKVLDDRIEFLTNDEDEERINGWKGKDIFRINEDSAILNLGYDEYRIWNYEFGIDVTFERKGKMLRDCTK